VTGTAKALVVSVAAALISAGCANGNDDATDAWPEFENLPVQSSIEAPDDAATAAGEGEAECETGLSIGFAGAMTGSDARMGKNIANGVRLAIDRHNRANPRCQVEFTTFDTTGDPSEATRVVTEAVNDASVIGVVGLPLSGESKATGTLFEDAGLAHITPSATSPELTRNGWKTFHRGTGNDEAQGPAAALLAQQLGAERVYVVQDDTVYGSGIGQTAAEALGAMLAGRDLVAEGHRDFSSTITKILKSKAHAVFFSGRHADAARFVQQLKARKFRGLFLAPERVMNEQFVRRAGSAANGTYFTCPCMPGELVPDFARPYRAAFDVAPGAYSIEAYDSTIVLLRGIDDGRNTRRQLLAFVESYSGQGYAKSYKWAADGELADTPVFDYKVELGKIVPVGAVD
jgi:branched-chain amino acid transport system substrate-binding protein